MKFAGLKNQGAWYRYNKFLKEIRTNINSVSQQFKQNLINDDGLLDIVDAMRGYLNNMTGVDPGAFATAMEAYGLPTSKQEQLTEWLQRGIPWQVWSGELSWDNYIKLMPGEAYPESDKVYNGIGPIYIKQNQAGFRKQAKLLRTTLQRHRKVFRQLVDISNVTEDPHFNPGGVADASRITA